MKQTFNQWFLGNALAEPAGRIVTEDKHYDDLASENRYYEALGREVEGLDTEDDEDDSATDEDEFVGYLAGTWPPRYL